MIGIRLEGYEPLISHWRFIARYKAMRETQAAVKDETFQMYLAVMRHASGRPGPNVITGAYLGSWYMTVTGLVGEVGTNAPQALRLEYGFVGVDSLGRHYAQPPYPHYTPALLEREGPYYDRMGRVMMEIFSGA